MSPDSKHLLKIIIEAAEDAYEGSPFINADLFISSLKTELALSEELTREERPTVGRSSYDAGVLADHGSAIPQVLKEKKEEEWEPKLEERYWFIRTDFNFWEGDETDQKIKANWTIYPTRKAAEAAFQKCKQALKD